MDIAEFVVERDRVLQTLDEKQIREFFSRPDVGVMMPRNTDVFWCAIHKAITAARTIPRAVRLVSKEWLTARGFRSADDGDLT